MLVIMYCVVVDWPSSTGRQKLMHARVPTQTCTFLQLGWGGRVNH